MKNISKMERFFKLNKKQKTNQLTQLQQLTVTSLNWHLIRNCDAIKTKKL